MSTIIVNRPSISIESTEEDVTPSERKLANRLATVNPQLSYIDSLGLVAMLSPGEIKYLLKPNTADNEVLEYMEAIEKAGRLGIEVANHLTASNPGLKRADLLGKVAELSPKDIECFLKTSIESKDYDDYEAALKNAKNLGLQVINLSSARTLAAALAADNQNLQYPIILGLIARLSPQNIEHLLKSNIESRDHRNYAEALKNARGLGLNVKNSCSNVVTLGGQTAIEAEEIIAATSRIKMPGNFRTQYPPGTDPSGDIQRAYLKKIAQPRD